MKPIHFIAPFAILGTALLAGFLILSMKPKPEKQLPQPVIPVVEAIEAKQQTFTLEVRTQGTVRPRTMPELTADVSGPVIAVSENFRPGGFFGKGEVLVTIDPADYETILAQAQSNLAQARLDLAQEEARAAQAREEFQQLGRGSPSELTLRVPQVERARALLESASAAVRKAERDLDRTRVKAPFDGRVLQQGIDIGQRAQTGVPLATVYATDIAEIRMPLSLDEASKIDLPVAYREGVVGSRPGVVFSSTVGGETHTWTGSIVRTEAAIDPQTRFTHVIAEVRNPYGRVPEQPERHPLRVGLFVQAVIKGKTLNNVVIFPRHALHGKNTVWVAENGNTLRKRSIQIAAIQEKNVVASDGLKDGELIVTSPLEFVTEGMPIQLAERQSSATTTDAATE